VGWGGGGGGGGGKGERSAGADGQQKMEQRVQCCQPRGSVCVGSVYVYGVFAGGGEGGRGYAYICSKRAGCSPLCELL